MPFEQYKRVLDQFKGPDARPGFERLSFMQLQGIGEPFLHPDAIAMLRYAHDLGLFTVVVSNMTIMTDRMAGELAASGLNVVMVSVDAIDPKICAEIRRGVHFDVLQRITENIARIQAAKRRLGVDTPKIEVASLLMRRTLHQVPELVSRLTSLGVTVIRFTDVVTTGIPPEMHFSDGSRCADETLLNLSKEERLRIMREIKTLDSAECRVEVPEDWGGVSQAQRDDAVFTCDDLWDKPYVTVEGIVTPCCFAPYKTQLPMGDLTRQSFEEIWFGEAYQRLRMQHLTTRPPAICYACPQRVKRVTRNALLHGEEGPGIEVRSHVFMGDHRFAFRSRRPRPK
jgi:MoaA/NifB/PqqE/SkfB family radical SAM enzyme